MLSVGLDVSKSKSTAAILNQDGSILAKPFNFKHNNPDMDAFVKYLREQNEPVKILMEYTGYYHYPVLKKLETEGFDVCLINPYAMKKYGDTELRRTKTDKKDALRIATYALEKSYQLVPHTSADDKYENLRLLSRQYVQRSSTLSVNKTHLYNLLDETMPGITGVLKFMTRNPEKCLALMFVKKFHSYDYIRKLGKAYCNLRFIC